MGIEFDNGKMPDNTVVATEVIGGENIQIVRTTGRFFSASIGLSGELPLDTGGYGAGEVMTDGTAGHDFEPGVYRVSRVVAVTSLGTALPAGFTIALVPYEEATEPTWPSDGDAFNPSFMGTSAMVAAYVGDFAPVYDNAGMRVSQDRPMLNVLASPAMDHVRLVMFTTDAVASFASGELLIISLTLEKIGTTVT
jgi:hypothetical protein